jgi:hypothetical protein
MNTKLIVKCGLILGFLCNNLYCSVYELAIYKPASLEFMAHKLDTRTSKLSDVAHSQFTIPPMWHHQATQSRIGNAPTVVQPTTTWQSLSIADKYSFCAQKCGDLSWEAFQKNHTEIAQLTYEQALTKLDELHGRLQILEHNYQQELLKASSEVQEKIKKCGEPLAITLSTKQPLWKQEQFAELMMNIRSIKTQIKIVQDAIEICKKRIEYHIAETSKSAIAAKTVEDVASDISSLKFDIEKLKLKAVKLAGKELVKMLREITTHSALVTYLESVMKEWLATHYIDQRLENLRELKDNLIIMQFDNVQFLKAIDKAISDKGCSDRTIHNALRNPEQELLAELNIPAEEFKQIHGDAFQQAAFKNANSILYTAALLNVQHRDNPHIKEYINTTTHLCYVSIKNAQSGTPQEAIVAALLTESLHKATIGVINFYKGVAMGTIESVKTTAELITHPTKIATDIQQACSLLLNIAKRDPETLQAISQSFELFLSLPESKQAEQIGSILGSLLTPSIASQISHMSSLNNALGNFSKLAKIELAALKNLIKVENCVITNIDGVSVPERFVASIQKLKELNLITKPEHITEYLNRIGAPFFINSRDAIKLIAKEVSAELKAIETTNSCIKDSYCADFQKYLQSLIQDPSHGNKISDLSIQEAAMGMACEKEGLLVGPLRRDPVGAAEFFDKFGQRWDVKRAISLSSNRQQIFNPKALFAKIKRDLLLGENIILDMMKLENRDVSIIYKEVFQKLTEAELNRMLVVMRENTLTFIKTQKQ